jgi:hypothetical protein
MAGLMRSRERSNLFHYLNKDTLNVMNWDYSSVPVIIIFDLLLESSFLKKVFYPSPGS